MKTIELIITKSDPSLNEVVFSHSEKDNTIKKTLFKAIKDEINLDSVTLENKDFSGVVFKDIKLKVYFKNCNMEGVVFENCNLDDIFFKGCNLKKSVFNKCSLIWAFICVCDMRGSKFTNCNEKDIFLKNNKNN